MNNLKYNKYPAYKHSGVDWLGEIPEGWELKKATHFFNQIGSGTTPTSGDLKFYNGPFNFLQTGDLNDGKIYYTNRTVKEEAFKHFSSLKLYPKGSLIMAMYGATIGKLGILEIDSATNQACCVFNEPKNILTEYFFYVLFAYRPYIISLSYGGGQPNISQDLIKSLRFPFPPLHEQKIIAEFLVDKTAKIDQAIAQKEKMMSLLKERKQIIIQDLVTGKKVWNEQENAWTKPAETKDSGVEWIGEIPKDWEVKRLKYVLKHPLKYGANESGIEYSPELPRYIRITDFSTNGKLNEEKKLSLTWEKGKDYLLEDGDILFARSGATVGKSYQFKKSMSREKYYSFAGYLIKASPNENVVISDFLNYYTMSGAFDNWKNSIFNKATIENIGADKYSELNVIIPKVRVQSQIVQEIEFQSAKIDRAVSLLEQEIEKLKEYKAVLIDNAVTGKIKV